MQDYIDISLLHPQGVSYALEGLLQRGPTCCIRFGPTDGQAAYVDTCIAFIAQLDGSAFSGLPAKPERVTLRSEAWRHLLREAGNTCCGEPAVLRVHSDRVQLRIRVSKGSEQRDMLEAPRCEDDTQDDDVTALRASLAERRTLFACTVPETSALKEAVGSFGGFEYIRLGVSARALVLDGVNPNGAISRLRKRLSCEVTMQSDLCVEVATVFCGYGVLPFSEGMRLRAMGGDDGVELLRTDAQYTVNPKRKRDESALRLHRTCAIIAPRATEA
jgi:hypothetical protein